MTIRWMIRSDMPEVLRIQKETLRYPWTEEEFLQALQGRNVIGMCRVEDDDKPLGYIVYKLFKKRVEIGNMAVDCHNQRRGIGTELIDYLIGKLSRNRRTRITTELADFNLPALQFFKAKLFEAVSIRFDSGLGLDVIKMIYDIKRIQFHPHNRGVQCWSTPLKHEL